MGLFGTLGGLAGTAFGTAFGGPVGGAVGAGLGNMLGGSLDQSLSNSPAIQMPTNAYQTTQNMATTGQGYKNAAESMMQNAQERNLAQATALTNTQRGSSPALAQRNANMAAMGSNAQMAANYMPVAAQQQMALFNLAQRYMQMGMEPQMAQQKAMMSLGGGTLMGLGQMGVSSLMQPSQPQPGGTGFAPSYTPGMSGSFSQPQQSSYDLSSQYGVPQQSMFGY